MQVNKWGPSAWEFLHTVTFNYSLNPDKEEKNNNIIFFKSLENILPCIYCKNSYSMYIKIIPIEEYMNDRMGLTFWLFIIHNLINNKLGKNIESFKTVVIKYEKNRAICGKITNENKKEILTCQKNLENIDFDKINKFVSETHKKYYKITKKYLKEYNSIIYS